MNSTYGDTSRQSDNLHFLEEIDPSLEGGFQIVYDREIPLELRTSINGQSSQEVGSLESIKVKILILPSTQSQSSSDQNQNVQQQQQQYQTIKIEFTSETDLFFFYVSMLKKVQFFNGIEEESFLETKKEQSIKISFDEYLSWLIKLFNQCYKEPNSYFGVFHMESEGIGRLDFIENMEYKFIEIVTLDFIANPEDLVKQNVIYRYNILKAKMLFLQSRLEDISNLIKLKNPSLLLQIQRNTIGPNSSTLRSAAAANKSANTSKFLK